MLTLDPGLKTGSHGIILILEIIIIQLIIILITIHILIIQIIIQIIILIGITGVCSRPGWAPCPALLSHTIRTHIGKPS